MLQLFKTIEEYEAALDAKTLPERFLDFEFTMTAGDLEEHLENLIQDEDEQTAERHAEIAALRAYFKTAPDAILFAEIDGGYSEGVRYYKQVADGNLVMVMAFDPTAEKDRPTYGFDDD